MSQKQLTAAEKLAAEKKAQAAAAQKQEKKMVAEEISKFCFPKCFGVDEQKTFDQLDDRTKRCLETCQDRYLKAAQVVGEAYLALLAEAGYDEFKKRATASKTKLPPK
eukprot:TRINITY_DN5455_c0_g1_i1.p1 TRINITY_DN5455_c0_g1~~TRINITY_DN5455_c0_g1_i1.p1  ORF type:complete len:108 (-),score=35.10 TRINITY_DN5455_c0_g1_i1:171-494(-)